MTDDLVRLDDGPRTVGSGQPVWINRDNGARCRVVEVNVAWAVLSIDNPGSLPSMYSMPIAEYDGDKSVPEARRFTTIWRPATPEDLVEAPMPNYRPPANIADDD